MCSEPIGRITLSTIGDRIAHEKYMRQTMLGDTDAQHNTFIGNNSGQLCRPKHQYKRGINTCTNPRRPFGGVEGIGLSIKCYDYLCARTNQTRPTLGWHFWCCRYFYCFRARDAAAKRCNHATQFQSGGNQCSINIKTYYSRCMYIHTWHMIRNSWCCWNLTRITKCLHAMLHSFVRERARRDWFHECCCVAFW